MTDPRLAWNLLADLRQLLEFPFMVNAFRAGAIVAVLAGLLGWFMVLRGQTFAGHTLAVVGFPGATGALLIGVSAGYGLFGFAVAAALLIGNRPRQGESAVIGTVQAMALASGFLFADRYGGFLGGIDGLLFGSFLGITTGQVRGLLVVAVLTCAALAGLARPLLFASVDPLAAEARGVPLAMLSRAFLLLLAVAAAGASVITGSLLVFTLLVIPAATARQLTANPALSVLLTVALALLLTWTSLAIAYFSADPIGFWLSSLAFAGYLLATATHRIRHR